MSRLPEDHDPLGGDGADRDDDSARLFRVARGASTELSPARKRALHGAILAAAAASAATAASSTATAATAAGHSSSAAAAGAGAGKLVAVTSASLAAKTALGALVGVLVGGAFVGAVTLVDRAADRAPAAHRVDAVSSPSGSAPPRAVDAQTAVGDAPPVSPAASSLAPAAAIAAPALGKRVAFERGNEAAPEQRTDDVPASSGLAETAPVPARGAGSLAEESAALQEVSRALGEGKTDEALRLLDQQQAGAVLAEERDAARIVALCQSGRVEDAEPLRASFLSAHPRSTQRARIEVACRARAGEP